MRFDAAEFLQSLGEGDVEVASEPPVMAEPPATDTLAPDAEPRPAPAGISYTAEPGGDMSVESGDWDAGVGTEAPGPDHEDTTARKGTKDTNGTALTWPPSGAVRIRTTEPLRFEGPARAVNVPAGTEAFIVNVETWPLSESERRELTFDALGNLRAERPVWLANQIRLVERRQFERV